MRLKLKTQTFAVIAAALSCPTPPHFGPFLLSDVSSQVSQEGHSDGHALPARMLASPHRPLPMILTLRNI